MKLKEFLIGIFNNVRDNYFDDDKINEYLLERITELYLYSQGYDIYRGELGQNETKISIRKLLNGNLNISRENGDIDVISKKGDNYVFVGCKYFNEVKLFEEYGIKQIMSVVYKYNGYQLWICIKNTKEFEEKMDKMTGKNNIETYEKIDRKLDITNLNIFLKGIIIIYKTYDNYIHSLLNDNNKPIYTLRPHQSMFLDEIIRIMNENKNKEILLNLICRSGKSFIFSSLSNKLISENKKCIYLTNYPSSVLNQTENIFRTYKDFSNIVIRNRENTQLKKETDIKTNSMYFFSLQYLKTNNKYKNIVGKFNLIIYDETQAHNTEKTKEIIEHLKDENTFILYSTATPKKIINNRLIDDKNILQWTYEDVMDLKNNNEGVYQRHPNLSNYGVNKEEINKIYLSFPTMKYHQLSFSEKSKKELKEFYDEDKGFDMKGLFSLTDEDKNGKRKFINPTYINILLDIIHNIIDKNKESNTLDTEFNGILMFVPYGEENVKLDIIGKLFKKLIMKNKYYKNYDCHFINDVKKNYKETVENWFDTSRGKKEGCIIICGDRLTVGVSLEYVNCVVLLNHISDSDLVFQMSMRCLTERKGKEYGLVIDTNPTRTLISLLNQITSSNNTKDKITKLIRRMLVIDESMFDGEEVKDYMEKMSEMVYTTINKQDLFKNLEILLKDVDLFVIKKSSLNPIQPEKKSLTFNKSNAEVKSGLVREVEYKNREDNENKDNEKIVIIDENNNLCNEEKKDIIEENKENKEEKKDIIEERNEEEDEKRKEDEIKEEEIKRNTEGNKWKKVFTYIIPSMLLFSDENVLDIYSIYENLKKNIRDKILNKLKEYFNCKEEQFEEMLSKNKFNLMDIVYKIRLQLKMSINLDNKISVLKFLETFLKPKEFEKKKNGEVFTPITLIEEIFDKLEKYKPDIFSIKEYKWLDPANGIGNFPICLYYRLFDGLKNIILDEEERKNHILHNMIYVCELNPINNEIYKKIMGSNVNVYEGDFLKFNHTKEFGVDKFDVIIGNPPYNSSREKRGNTNTLWDKFVLKSIKLCNYLLFIHPPRWRKVYEINNKNNKKDNLFDLLTHKNQMIYLSMNDIKTGKKIFGCGTRFDWYIVEMKKKYRNTDINDIIGIDVSIDLGKWKWLPNFNFSEIYRLIKKKEKLEVMRSRSLYGHDKDWVSEKKDDVYKYPLIYSTNKNGIRYNYSSKNNGHFGVSKLIFGTNRVYDCVIDDKGKYGMTDSSMGIIISSKKEGILMKKVIESYKFQCILKSCSWSNFNVEWCLFKYINKNFYNEFNTSFYLIDKKELIIDGDTKTVNKEYLMKLPINKLIKICSDNKIECFNDNKDDIVYSILSI